MKGGIGMSTMSFRINDSTKKEFEDICEKLGMNPSTALTIFIKKNVQRAKNSIRGFSL